MSENTTESERKLLDCPFCGSFAKEEQTRGSFGGYNLTTVYCQNCGASAPDKQKWNERANDSGKDSASGVSVNARVSCTDDWNNAEANKPEPLKTVVVWVDIVEDDTVEPFMEITAWNELAGEWCWKPMEPYKITHWAYAPEPPK